MMLLPLCREAVDAILAGAADIEGVGHRGEVLLRADQGNEPSLAPP